MINLKRPVTDPENYHTLFLEAGLALSLGIVLLVFKMPFNPKTKPIAVTQTSEVVTMEDVVKTKQNEMPPSPPAPEVPEAVPNDQVIPDVPLNMSTELNINEALPLPTAPPESKEDEENQNDENKIFVVVQRMPKLIGGFEGLEKKIVYPELAKQANIEGRVFVEFIIDQHGNVINPKIVRGIGGGCDEEAIRVIEQAKFRPGMQRGRTVKVRYTMPVIFKLVNNQ